MKKYPVARSPKGRLPADQISGCFMDLVVASTG